jgi:hypothetical protein
VPPHSTRTKRWSRSELDQEGARWPIPVICPGWDASTPAFNLCAVLCLQLLCFEGGGGAGGAEAGGGGAVRTRGHGPLKKAMDLDWLKLGTLGCCISGRRAGREPVILEWPSIRGRRAGEGARGRVTLVGGVGRTRERRSEVCTDMYVRCPSLAPFM